MDKGHREADKILAEMFDEMLTVFDKVDRKIIRKLKKYLKKFESEIKEKEQQVDDGQITEREYNAWIINRITTGREWETLRDEMAQDYHDATVEAMAMAGSGLMAVYAYNKIFSNKSIQQQVKTHFQKSIRLSNTTRPRRPKGILPKSPDPLKNLPWHRRKIESVIRSGMKKGQSVDKIARKLHKVTNMDRVSAYRAVRTGVTCAENEARIDAMYEAENLGIPYDKIWLATMDDRTRVSHRVINGERVPWNEFFSNGLYEPADPSGEPEEVYNCRCRLLWAPAGVDMEVPQGPDGMGKLEWSAQKPVSKPYPKWKKENENG